MLRIFPLSSRCGHTLVPRYRSNFFWPRDVVENHWGFWAWESLFLWRSNFSHSYVALDFFNGHISVAQHVGKGLYFSQAVTTVNPRKTVGTVRSVGALWIADWKNDVATKDTGVPEVSIDVILVFVISMESCAGGRRVAILWRNSFLCLIITVAQRCVIYIYAVVDCRHLNHHRRRDGHSLWADIQIRCSLDAQLQTSLWPLRYWIRISIEMWF